MASGLSYDRCPYSENMPFAPCTMHHFMSHLRAIYEPLRTIYEPLRTSHTDKSVPFVAQTAKNLCAWWQKSAVFTLIIIYIKISIVSVFITCCFITSF